jgi:hypothetical protein
VFVDLRFFTKFFILQQCLDPNQNPNFFSDSDPAKLFGFCRIRIQYTGYRRTYVQAKLLDVYPILSFNLPVLVPTTNKIVSEQTLRGKGTGTGTLIHSYLPESL